MKRHILPWISCALLSVSVAAQQAQSGADSPKTNSTVAQIIILDGTQITGHDVVVRNGVPYVSVPALAKSLGAAVTSKGPVAWISFPAISDAECQGIPLAWKLSDGYRKAAVGIPDAIESLRAMANKRAAVIPVASFDEVDRQIAEAQFRAETDADKSVSYALSKANNRLAITYFKLWRGVPPEAAKQEQLESVLCSMESKFALQVGRLSGRESCSVFHLQQEADAPATSN